MNVKQHISLHIIPLDDSNALAPFLEQLDENDRYHLLDTCFQEDAIKCFRLLYCGRYSVQLYVHVPPRICAALANDRGLFDRLAQECANTDLVQYFCSVPISWYTLDIIAMFVNANANEPVVRYVCNRIKSDAFDATPLPEKRFFVEACLCSSDSMSLFINKFNWFWGLLTPVQKLACDAPRKKQEDWEQLLFCPLLQPDSLEKHVLVLRKILADSLTDNWHLRSPLAAGQNIERVQEIWNGVVKRRVTGRV